jgi:hypothetical protein
MEDFTNAADYDGKAIFGLATATVTLDRLAKLAAHRGEVFIDVNRRGILTPDRRALETPSH